MPCIVLISKPLGRETQRLSNFRMTGNTIHLLKKMNVRSDTHGLRLSAQ